MQIPGSSSIPPESEIPGSVLRSLLDYPDAHYSLRTTALKKFHLPGQWEGLWKMGIWNCWNTRNIKFTILTILSVVQ